MLVPTHEISSDKEIMTRHDVTLQGTNNTAVLLLHGLWSSPTELQPIARALHQAGFTVEMPIIPGYSFQPGDKVRHWQDWCNTIQNRFRELKKHYQHVAAGGLCIGSVLALHLAASEPVAALTLMSTTLRYDGWALPRWLVALSPILCATPLHRIMSYREHEPYGLKNAALRKKIANNMLQQGESEVGPAMIPGTATREALALSRVVQRQLPTIMAPTLILHAVDDETASLRNAQMLEAGLGSPIRRTILLRNSYHIITIDNDRKLVAKETVRFLREHAG